MIKYVFIWLKVLLEDENENIKKSLKRAKRNIKNLKDHKAVLHNQLNLEKRENGRLRDRVRQLENENQGLNNQNQNLRNSLDSCQETDKNLMVNNFLWSLSVSSDLMKFEFRHNDFIM